MYYFNPRPREEGDPNGKFASDGQKISIHALVKRATILENILGVMPRDFNPRPREEGDPFLKVISSKFKRISIHALVKRATF